MNKIIIVGHPSTPFLDIERLLHECGMAGAMPSRKEGFTPAEVGATLLKAHGVSSDALVAGGGTLTQLEPGPLWQGLILDLMLGNIDQQFWGWSDSNAIHLLDYWKQLDPDIKFVFIYSNPVAALSSAEDGAQLVDIKMLDQRLKAWSAFNSEMLHFFNRNPERSVLVHGDEARSSVKTYLQHLRTRLDAPLAEPPAYLLTNQDACAPSNVAHWTESHAGGGSIAGYGNLTLEQHRSALGRRSVLKPFLAELVIAQFPEAGQVYEDLQSVATLPMHRSERTAIPVLAAWLDLQAQEQSFEQNERALAEYKANNSAERIAFRQKLELLEGANCSLSEQVDSLGLVNGALKDELHVHRVAKEELHADHMQVLAELQKLQRSLQQQMFEHDDQQERLNSLTSVLQTKESEHRRLEAELLTSRAELESKEVALGRAGARLSQVEAANRDALAEASQLLSQLLAVQEDLERRTAATEAEKLALERLNRQLVAVQTDAAANARDFNDRLMTVDTAKAELQLEYEQIFVQLRIVQEELELLYRDNRDLRKKELLRNPPLYGAADRIKQQLTYRVGSTILESSKSVTGWIGMPIALIQTTRAFRKARRASANVKLPAISQYRDAQEAERTKQHLSYRIGKVFLENIGSPIGWFRLPAAMRKSVQEFQAARATRK
ncbi:hypothetical protein [Achromobacter insolitus]|uniref:hypothetical protein n=1 Tax=Achromobacter insolitus TaxID=217204 RepID=UPI002FE288B1